MKNNPIMCLLVFPNNFTMKKWIFGFGAVAVLVGATFFIPNSKYLFTSVISPSSEVVLETNFGDITVELYANKAPITVGNFLCLAEKRKYNNTIFHRVVPDFIIQGGDYERGDGTGGKNCNGKEFNDEFSDLSHTRGTISMANRGPNTNASQFFIVVEDATFLDGRHSAFGKVIGGMNVVDTISKLETTITEKPKEKVVLKRIRIK